MSASTKKNLVNCTKIPVEIDPFLALFVPEKSAYLNRNFGTGSHIFNLTTKRFVLADFENLLYNYIISTPKLTFLFLNDIFLLLLVLM